MRNCRKAKSSFLDSIYNSIGKLEGKYLTEHLRQCEKCSVKFKNLQNTVSIVSEKTREEPEEEFWSTYWIRLNNRMERETRKAKVSVKSRRFRFQLSYQLVGAAALLILCILIGWSQLGPHKSSRLPIEHVAPTISSIERFQSYLSKSKVLLLGIANMDTSIASSQPIDISNERELSHKLLIEASAIKTQLSNGEYEKLRNLIDDLDVILTVMANMEPHIEPSEVELLREGIEGKGLLLKIYIQEMDLAVVAYRESDSSSQMEPERT